MIKKKIFMLKFLYVAQIATCCALLADFNPDFNHIVLSCMDGLLDLPYMTGKA